MDAAKVSKGDCPLRGFYMPFGRAAAWDPCNKKALFGEVTNSKQGCFIRLHIVGIRLEQQRNEVDQPANTEQTDSKQVQDPLSVLLSISQEDMMDERVEGCIEEMLEDYVW